MHISSNYQARPRWACDASYAEPLQSTLGYNDEGYAAAMTSGNIIQAAVNILCRNNLFWFRVTTSGGLISASSLKLISTKINQEGSIEEDDDLDTTIDDELSAALL